LPSKKNPIQEHPEFPFAKSLGPRIDGWLSGFVDAPDPESPAGALLRQFLEQVDRYAFLERIVQGDIRYDLPVHSRFALEQSQGDPEEGGETIAATELELLGKTEQPGFDLADELEEMGIKLFFLQSEPEDSDPVGAIFYEGDTGPAFLVGTRRDSILAPFVIAHALGHLIADVDPYRPRFCRWDRGDLANAQETVEEIRADRFARALLLPPGQLQTTLEQITTSPDSRQGNRLALIETLHRVPVPVVRRRLIELGLAVDPDPVADQAEPWKAATEEAPETPRGSGPFELPSRFVNLSLAIYADRLMDRDLLSLFLGLSETETQQVLDWTGVPRLRPETGS